MSVLGIIGRVVVTTVAAMAAYSACRESPERDDSMRRSQFIGQVFSLFVLVGAGLSWL